MLFGIKRKPEIDNDRIKVNTSTITTFIGTDCVFEGKLSTKASVRIDGTVIGDIRTEGVIVLTKTGKVVGTIEAESIIVAGVIEGNMSIRDKVNVEPSGEIYGDIVTSKFVIDEESIFQGNCIMNRDGEYIPVTPYNKDKKKSEENSTEEKNESEVKEVKKYKKNRRRKTKNVESKPEEKEVENTASDSKTEEENSKPEEVLDDEIEISDIDELHGDEGNTKKKTTTTSKSLNVEIEES